jgi:hypothetical protein
VESHPAAIVPEDLEAARKLWKESRFPSVALIQRRLGIGYNYAQQIVLAITGSVNPLAHPSQLAPEANKFHAGNGDDGKHYWLTPPELLAQLSAEFGPFDFDPCPYPKPADFDGLTCEWGQRNYVNPPFGSILHQGKKKGPTAWVRKAIEEHRKGKTVVLVYPVDKWILMLLSEIGASVRNLGDVKWLATEDGSAGKGTGRHIACFILEAQESA